MELKDDLRVVAQERALQVRSEVEGGGHKLGDAFRTAHTAVAMVSQNGCAPSAGTKKCIGQHFHSKKKIGNPGIQSDTPSQPLSIDPTPITLLLGKEVRLGTPVRRGSDQYLPAY